jgi:hypothetical protein
MHFEAKHAVDESLYAGRMQPQSEFHSGPGGASRGVRNGEIGPAVPDWVFPAKKMDGEQAQMPFKRQRGDKEDRSSSLNALLVGAHDCILCILDLCTHPLRKKATPSTKSALALSIEHVLVYVWRLGVVARRHPCSFGSVLASPDFRRENQSFRLGSPVLEPMRSSPWSDSFHLELLK